MVNTHIGELAIHAGGKDFIFRPLFCRVAELGSPKEIFKLFEDVQQGNKDGFMAAIQILNTFADEDPAEAIGEYIEDLDRNGRPVAKYRAGYCPIQDIHVLGCKIMQDAIIGRPSERDKSKASGGRKVYEFNPVEFVAIGDAHMSGRDGGWWNATMIELQHAIKAKNPDDEKDTHMTADEIQSLYDMVDGVKH
jgi:hypothetical protein